MLVLSGTAAQARCSQRVYLYSASWCPSCRQVRAILDRNNIHYTLLDATTPSVQTDMVARFGDTAIPRDAYIHPVMFEVQLGMSGLRQAVFGKQNVCPVAHAYILIDWMHKERILLDPMLQKVGERLHLSVELFEDFLGTFQVPIDSHRFQADRQIPGLVGGKDP